MANLADTFLLAVDGGGTRCRFALVRGSERWDVEAGAANAFSDFDGAVQTVHAGAEALATQAAQPLGKILAATAFVGLAGVVTPAIVARLAYALPFENAEYADDRRMALRGALGGADGLIAHCGTGSFLGAQIAGDVRLAGGWGLVLGDEASAQWVGRQACKRALRLADGFEPDSALLTEILEHLGGADGILRFASTATPSAYGTLAPRVTAHAAQGEDVSIEILRAGATYLSEGLDRLGWRPGLRLCLTGGIGSQYSAYLPQDKQRDLTPPQGSPLDGAIDLARARLSEAHDGHL